MGTSEFECRAFIAVPVLVRYISCGGASAHVVGFPDNMRAGSLASLPALEMDGLEAHPTRERLYLIDRKIAICIRTSYSGNICSSERSLQIAEVNNSRLCLSSMRNTNKSSRFLLKRCRFFNFLID